MDRTIEPPKTVTGEEEIKAYLKHLNSEARTREHLLTDETYLDLQIPIAALQGAGGINAAAQAVTIRLFDTPGPNEAGEIALKAQVGVAQDISFKLTCTSCLQSYGIATWAAA